MYSDSLLIVFVKNLRRGKVKTRLAESVGEGEALRIYHLLLHHTRDIVIPLEMDVQVWYSDFIPMNDFWDRAPDVEQRIQKGPDLGSRMKHSMETGFSEGYRHIVIIGSDCAELSTPVLEKAFEMLKTKDTVVGPSRDGGYYLIGMSKPVPELFNGITWSTATVCQTTLEKISRYGLTVHKLPVLNDVDTEEDWKEVAGELDSQDV